MALAWLLCANRLNPLFTYSIIATVCGPALTQGGKASIRRYCDKAEFYCRLSSAAETTPLTINPDMYNTQGGAEVALNAMADARRNPNEIDGVPTYGGIPVTIAHYFGCPGCASGSMQFQLSDLGFLRS